jgi:formamidopyrimidine-DNA glycosylase
MASMPELPEVETTLRGLKPYIIHQKMANIVIYQPQLRWPIPNDLNSEIGGQMLQRLHRRGKYLLFKFQTGTLIVHLGMSGRLCILSDYLPPRQHDHVDIHFTNKTYLRFTDPRRFGALLWTRNHPLAHPLLIHMGPEPFSKHFDSRYLWEVTREKKTPIKACIMNSKVVAGLGNIYATEALFYARLHPLIAAGKTSKIQCQALTHAIKVILKKAIVKGGTTLKDYTKSDGSPGHFSLELQVYGRADQPCPRCLTTLKNTRIGQRSTVFCDQCQS